MWLTVTAAAAIAAGSIVVLAQKQSGRGAPLAAPAPSAGPVGAGSIGRPILWVLAIGVSQYADPALALRFASDDARAVATALTAQRSGPLYADVKTRVLLDGDVTRASVLEALGDDFLGKAAPIDVGVVYLAGHGVHDESLDSSYFLPANASAKTPLIDGLDMVELERQLRRAHRNLQRLVVVLDTCHAGVVADAAGGVRFGEDLAARLAPADGLYILAAARAGERSMELETLHHGAFTKALLDGLDGAAANAAGLTTVFTLAGYTAQVVPELTGERQHPYQAIVGEDLAVAGDPRAFARVTPPPLPSPGRAGAAPARRERIAVMNFENLRPDPEHDWMTVALREEFATTLNALTQLEVYAEPEVRFLARGTEDPIEAARRTDMSKVVSGTFAVQNDHISMTAHVKDTETLKHIASAKADGSLQQFFVLRNRLVLDLLEQLRVGLPRAEAERILKPGSTDLAARKLLFEAESSHSEPGVAPTPTPAAGKEPHAASQRGPLFAFMEIASPSYAAESADLDTEVRATLEGYRIAFEQKNLDALAHYYAAFGEAQRTALVHYFHNADDLQVEFRDIRIAIIGDRASASFTRQDHFVDHQTGERHELIVRLIKLLAKEPEGWRILPEE